ncbi:MAG: hypothetical protein ACLFN5_04025 [bacterium]
MANSSETKFTLLAEAGIKLFALYMLFYYLFFSGMQNVYIYFLTYKQIDEEDFTQIYTRTITYFIPIAAALIFIWWGKKIVGWLFAEDFSVSMGWVKPEYVIRLLLVIVSLYYIFRGVPTVLNWGADKILSPVDHSQQVYSRLGIPGNEAFRAAIQLLFAGLLLCYFKPAANWLTERVIGD